jgi:tRNA (guanine-N7-)-methyltransferase
MRKKKHGAERISACADLIIDNPANAFDDGREIELEIGCGKGQFICEMAKRNPDKGYIAIETVGDVILLAMEKAKREGIENIKFMNCDAKILGDLIPENSISVMYLNFNDPWPKKGYYKRRLTYRAFLNIYKRFLKVGGEIRLKTDNVGYFDFSLGQFMENGFTLSQLTRDLHNSEYDSENIRTEYENNFSAKGFNINRVVATLIDATIIPEEARRTEESDTEE